MDNSAGLAPQYRDVIHEDALRVGPHVKAPDCAFTLHGRRKFFLEAKKPAVNIKSGADPAYQLRRYAWSAKMPLSILSDFEEFAKLIIQVTARRPTIMLDESGLHITGGGSGPFYGIRPKPGGPSLRFLLGVMNSKLFGTIIRSQSTDLRGGYIKFSKQYIQSAAFPAPGTSEHATASSLWWTACWISNGSAPPPKPRTSKPRWRARYSNPAPAEHGTPRITNRRHGSGDGGDQ